jgi:hypothetical protein
MTSLEGRVFQHLLGTCLCSCIHSIYTLRISRSVEMYYSELIESPSTSAVWRYGIIGDRYRNGVQLHEIHGSALSNHLWHNKVINFTTTGILFEQHAMFWVKLSTMSYVLCSKTLLSAFSLCVEQCHSAFNVKNTLWKTKDLLAATLDS